MVLQHLSGPPTGATYDPATGEFIMVIPSNTITTNDVIRLDLESFVFTCAMDGNATEHALPGAYQLAGTQARPVTNV